MAGCFSESEMLGSGDAGEMRTLRVKTILALWGSH